MTTENGIPSLGQRAEQGARWAYDTLGRAAGTARNEDRLETRQAAGIYAVIAATFSMRDLAESNRDLARANMQLALSYDRWVDELMRRRGAPEAAD